MPAPKQFTDEQIKERGKQSRARWEESNPDKVAEKRARENARNKAKRGERAKQRKEAKKLVTGKVCKQCGTDRPFTEYQRHGSGYKPVCLICKPYVPTKAGIHQAAWAKRNAEKVREMKQRSREKKKSGMPVFVRVKKEHKPVTIDPNYGKMERYGWRKLWGIGDCTEYLIVYIRGPIILFQRGQLGSYSAGKASFGIVGDDSGMRYLTLSKAEKAAEKIYGGVK